MRLHLVIIRGLWLVPQPDYMSNIVLLDFWIQMANTDFSLFSVLNVLSASVFLYQMITWMTDLQITKPLQGCFSVSEKEIFSSFNHEALVCCRGWRFLQGRDNRFDNALRCCPQTCDAHSCVNMYRCISRKPLHLV